MNTPQDAEDTTPENSAQTSAAGPVAAAAQESPAPPAVGGPGEARGSGKTSAPTQPEAAPNAATPTPRHDPPIPASPTQAPAVNRDEGGNKLTISPMLGKTELLSESVQADYYACEEVIASGWNTFVQVGLALARIRDGELYRAGGYDSFEQYCRLKWEYGPNYVHRLISAAQVFTNLLTNRVKKSPSARRRSDRWLDSPPIRREWPGSAPFKRPRAVRSPPQSSDPPSGSLGWTEAKKAWPASPPKVEPKGAA